MELDLISLDVLQEGGDSVEDEPYLSRSSLTATGQGANVVRYGFTPLPGFRISIVRLDDALSRTATEDGNGQPRRQDGSEMSSSSEDKEIVRRVFEAFYAVDADTLQELLSPDFVAHSMPPGFSKDQEGFLEMARQWAAGFSDDDTTLDELLAAEDGKVVTRFTTRATHSRDAFGVAASNRRITMTGIEIYAVAEGKVTHWWGEINMSDLFDPPVEQAASAREGSA